MNYTQFSKHCEDLVNVIPQNQSDDLVIDHFTISKSQYELACVKSAIKGTFKDITSLEVEKKYIRLYRNNWAKDIVMSNTPMERETNYDIIQHAHGDILIAGLGIGMILYALSKIVDVKSVTVIENNKSVIDMVWPHLKLPSNFNVFHEDIFKFETKKKYDVIYFDIWDFICGDNYEEMKKLKMKFRKNINRKNLKCWMGCWRFEDMADLYHHGR
jgi:hypothetical protein